MPLLRTLALACAAVMLMKGPPAGPQNPVPKASVRLHHLHFRTDDVAAAMGNAMKRHAGTTSIVQGLGPGVRVVDTYLLFDRLNGAVIDRSQPAPTAANAFIDAAQWLGARGIDATNSEAGTKILLGDPVDVRLDHLGFASTNPDGVVAVLRTAGASELRRTGDSVFFRTDSLPIEITRETELPDAFWCPMHPHVRGPYVARCPICSMDLVPIPPPRIGEYRVDVTQVPAANGKGLRALTLQIRDPDSGTPVAMFAETHKRLLHLFIIGWDLHYFAHEHPVQTDAGFDLDVDLPPGAYMLIADFLPGGGYPQIVHRAIVTPGHTSSPFAVVPRLSEDLTDKVVQGVRVQLAVSQAVGRPEAVLRFTFSDATTGVPVRDLQLYLGSAGHLLVVRPDLTDSVHAHPEGKTSGPDIDFGVVFPAAGLYKVWIQVQRGGRVITAPFVVGIRQ